MSCSFASPENVKVCVDLLFPWASMLLGLLGLILVFWNLGANSVIAYILKSAQRQADEANAANRRADDADQRYQELARIVSGPLTNYQNLTLETQAAVRRAEKAERELSETQQRFEAFRSAPQATNSEASAALSQVEAKLTAIEARLSSVRESFRDEGKPFWSRPPGVSVSELQKVLATSIPIIMFANQKGGVGKTTLSANLAAYFQHRGGERVLALDLDYQRRVRLDIPNLTTYIPTS